MPAGVVAPRVTSTRWPSGIGGQGDGIPLGAEQYAMPPGRWTAAAVGTAADDAALTESLMPPRGLPWNGRCRQPRSPVCEQHGTAKDSELTRRPRKDGAMRIGLTSIFVD